MDKEHLSCTPHIVDSPEHRIYKQSTSDIMQYCKIKLIHSTQYFLENGVDYLDKSKVVYHMQISFFKIWICTTCHVVFSKK